MKNSLCQIFKKYFAKNLTWQVEKEASSLKKGKSFTRSRLSLFERNITTWSANHKKYIFRLSLMFFLIGLFIWLAILPNAKGKLPTYESAEELNALFLALQITIIGLIYPLVISLIGVLFQNMSGKRVVFYLYQKYSGFMFSGLSAITLSIFMSINYFLESLIDKEIYITIVCVNIIWFIFNLFLTAWFFIKTLEIIDERKKDKFIFRYVVNEICSFDIVNRRKNRLLKYPIINGIITLADPNVLNITELSVDNRYKKISVPNDREKTLSGIALLLLNIALWLQTKLLARKKQEGKMTIKPYQPKNSDEFIIGAYSGFEINPFVLFLIRKSFLFRTKTLEEDIGLHSALQIYIGDVENSLKNDEGAAYTVAIERLTSFHAQLGEILFFRNSQNIESSWLFADEGGYFSSSYLDDFLREYYRISTIAIAKISSDSQYFRPFLRFYQQIYLSQTKITQQEVDYLIRGSYYMWGDVLRQANIDKEKSFMWFDSILIDFLSKWKYWQTYLKIDKKFANNQFLANKHLEYTTMLPVIALSHNNEEAIKRGIDYLNSWLHHHDSYRSFPQENQWRSSIIVSCADLTEKDWQYIARGENISENKEIVKWIGLKNTNTDFRILVASFVLKHQTSNANSVKEHINHLLTGELFYDTGVPQNSKSCNRAQDILSTYFRIKRREYRNDYQRWIESILQGFESNSKNHVIEGVVYASTPLDLAAIQRFLVEMMISLSSNTWGISSEWKQAFSELYNFEERELLIGELEQLVKDAKQLTESILIQEQELAPYKDNFCQSLNKVITDLKSLQTTYLAKAPVSEEKINQIAGYASSIFIDERYPFPLNLLNIRHAELDKQHTYKAIVKSYEKKLLIDDFTTNIFGEDDFFKGCIRENLTRNVSCEIIKNTADIPIEQFNTIVDLVEKVRRESSEGEMVLLCGLAEVREYVESSLPSTHLRYEHRQNFPSEYLGKISNCEVYDIGDGVGFSVFIHKDFFDSIVFDSSKKDNYVDVLFDNILDEQSRGNLILSYKMEVLLNSEAFASKFVLK